MRLLFPGPALRVQVVSGTLCVIRVLLGEILAEKGTRGKERRWESRFQNFRMVVTDAPFPVIHLPAPSVKAM